MKEVKNPFLFMDKISILFIVVIEIVVLFILVKI